MDNKIYKYLFIGEYMFSLEYLYSDFTKGYTKLGLYWIGINGKRYEINVYYVKLLGNLFGKIELDKDIDRDIRQWLKKRR